MVNYLSDYQKGLITNDKFLDKLNYLALILTYISITMFASTYIYMASWVYTGERLTRQIRERYLRAVLRQNIAYFDKLGAGEITTRITSDTHLIKDGISDKAAIFISVCIKKMC